MTASDIWTLIGLAFGTLGAVLLAYDVVFGAGNRFRADTLKRQLETLKHTRDYVRTSIRSLGGAYTPADIQKLLDEEDQKWGPQENQLTKKAKEFYDRYENRVVTLGAFGVILIVIGFALQIVGLLVHAGEPSNRSSSLRIAPSYAMRAPCDFRVAGSSGPRIAARRA